MAETSETEVCCTEESKMKKLRILALHGYRQNGKVFKDKTGSFRKICHKWAQFNYITAPHKVLYVDDLNSDTKLETAIDQDEYGWFFNRDDMTYRGIRKGGPAHGYEASIRFIEDIFKTEGPFDGILGFSQGGCLLGLICDMQQRGLIDLDFKFVVIISGFISGCLPHLKYYVDPINLPSLHIFGEADKIIPTEMSEGLSDSFEDPVIVKHTGGHYVPASNAQKEIYQSFFQAKWLEKFDENSTEMPSSS